MSFKSCKMFPIDDDDKFEKFCLDVFREYYHDKNIQQNGRKGQRQNGVDVFCHKENDINHWIGIQCKVRNSDKIKENDIDIELEKALNFNPRISEYIIATTCKRDAIIQQFVRNKNTEYFNRGLFEIRILFWEDFEKLLEEDIYIPILLKYFSDFFIDSFKLGSSIGRIFTLSLGINEKYTTQYELIIGKIPIFDESKDTDLFYYQGSHYLINLQDRTFILFRDYVDPSELDNICITKLDRKMVSTWINSTPIDELLYDDTQKYSFSFSDEDYKNFLNHCE